VKDASGTATCNVHIVPVTSSTSGCVCYDATGTTQMISFGGGDISSVALSWSGVPGESNLAVDVDGTCQLAYNPASTLPPSGPTPPPPTAPTAPTPRPCPRVDSVRFNLESDGCQLPTCDAACMSAYLYSQAYVKDASGTATCNVHIVPVTSSTSGCVCYDATGTTQMISFGGGDISSVALSWSGVPGESNLAVDVDGTCQLTYNPARASGLPSSRGIPKWALIVTITVTGLVAFIIVVSIYLCRHRPVRPPNKSRIQGIYEDDEGGDQVELLSHSR